MQKKIVLAGGPGTGKTSVLNELKRGGYYCMPEISRDITIKAQQEGIQQLFLTDPYLFSKLLFEGRENQYKNASKTNQKFVFFDRGLPDIQAYMEYAKQEYPVDLREKIMNYRYDHVFIFKPWKKIYISDNERYENFTESLEIDSYLQKVYEELGYSPIEVPFNSIEKRAEFILNWLNKNA